MEKTGVLSSCYFPGRHLHLLVNSKQIVLPQLGHLPALERAIKEGGMRLQRRKIK